MKTEFLHAAKTAVKLSVSFVGSKSHTPGTRNREQSICTRRPWGQKNSSLQISLLAEDKGKSLTDSYQSIPEQTATIKSGSWHDFVPSISGLTPLLSVSSWWVMSDALGSDRRVGEVIKVCLERREGILS